MGNMKNLNGLWKKLYCLASSKFYSDEFLNFSSNIDLIDNKIKQLCPRGTHSEWDEFPIVETQGIKENHAYNNFFIYDNADEYNIIFEMEIKSGIDKHCEDMRIKAMGYDFETGKETNWRPPTFEEQRYWIGEEAVSRYKFFKSLSGEDLDYFNFKMEELILGLI